MNFWEKLYKKISMNSNIYHPDGQIAYRASDGWIFHTNHQTAYRPSDGWAFHSNNQIAFRESDGWAFHSNNQIAFRSDGLAINENNQVLSRDGSGINIELGSGISMFVGHKTLKIWVYGKLVINR